MGKNTDEDSFEFKELGKDTLNKNIDEIIKIIKSKKN